MIKHLVTSGCSFSDNHGSRWPHYLAKETGLPLYNYGHGSTGNNWIASSIIYQLSKLLHTGVLPEEILVCAMWSGQDRVDSFINTETNNYEKLHQQLNAGMSNPINFTDMEPGHSPRPGDPPEGPGWLAGSMHCSFNNENISKFKRDLISNFYNSELLMMESINNWLRLQWFCQSKNIQLLNLTYMNIWHYPNNMITFITEPVHPNKKGVAQPKVDFTIPLFFETFSQHIGHLYDLLDLDTWSFSGEDFGGLFEWCKIHNKPFGLDGVHPEEVSHADYAKHYLLPIVEKLIARSETKEERIERLMAASLKRDPFIYD